MRSRLHPHPRGFTLLEVLATMALMTIVLPILMEGFTLADRMSGEARHKIEAASLAAAKEQELIATGQATTSGLGGDFAPDWPEYHWTMMSTAPESVQDLNMPDLVQVTMRVTWQQRGNERYVDVTTWAYVGTGTGTTASSTGGTTGGGGGGGGGAGGTTGARTGGPGR